MFLTSLPLDREEMKSLQAALQKQLDEANEKAEKQQATVRQRWPHHQRSVSSNQPRHLSHSPPWWSTLITQQLAFSSVSQLQTETLTQQEKTFCHILFFWLQFWNPDLMCILWYNIMERSKRFNLNRWSWLFSVTCWTKLLFFR